MGERPGFPGPNMNSLEDEFTLATALIKARDAAHITQEDVAKAMGTSQEAIARLESGKSQPSTRTSRDASPRRPVCASG